MVRLSNPFDFGSGMQTGAPCPQCLPARRMLPRTAPSLAKCAFWVHISLNNDLANIRLTLQRVLNFGGSPKAQKCIKKAPPGMPEALKFIRLSNRFDFSSTLPAGFQMGHAKPRRVIWRGVTCLHRAPAALGRPARYSFGCFALRAPHHRGFARRPLLWAVL